MASTDPTLWSATDQAAAIASGDLGSRELLDAQLQRLDDVNGDLNAVVTLDVERASAAALAADEAVAAGGPLGPLHGLPITIKDALETEGIRSTGGANELHAHVPTANAPAVQSVVDAGALIWGKTNLPEWSGDLQSYNELFGRTNNPWDITRTPGGSSGGAAAAVSAGLTSFEIGTDIGGSVRLPAAYSGVYGHKPSHGIIPTLGYLDHVGGGTTEADVNVFGPLTRSVDDLELLVDLMTAPTPERTTAWSITLPPPRHESLAGHRIAVWADDPACPVDTEIQEAIEVAATALEQAGATVDRTARPDFDPAAVAQLGLGMISVAAAVAKGRDEIDRLVEKHGPDVAIAIRHLDWLQADKIRTEIRSRWAEFFTHHDALLCPVTISAAFEHQTEGEWRDRRLTINGESRRYADLVFWTSMIGMAYLPSTVPTIGFTSAGMPIGVQVVGPYLEDRTTMALTRHLVDVTDGAGYQPPPIVA